MKRIIAVVVLLIAATSNVLGQLSTTLVSTTLGGPLTATGVPIYGIVENGELLWYFHQGADNGSFLWANGGQRVVVGSGWNDGLKVFKGSPRGEDGVIYRVDSGGDLLWYRHFGYAVGSKSWAGAKKVGSGWQSARLVFAAGDGIIYMIHNNGDLLWYRHLGYDNGNMEWANGGGSAKVGSGWSNIRLAFSGGNGVIYAIDEHGDLYWYRHEGYTDGTFKWSNGASGIKVGSGWSEVVSAFSGGDGVIYALKRDGSLYWYNHSGYMTGAVTWSTGTGNKIGTGWGEMLRIF
jgi:hypothetical protein